MENLPVKDWIARITLGLNSIETVWRTLRLLIRRYPFHLLTDSRIEGHDGKAPSELAGANIEGIGWVQFSQKQRH